jgi:CRISPR-associated protein Csb2
LRLFQALAAAAAARWNERSRLEYAAPALEWLEKQPAPTIIAPVGVASDAPYLLYIPNNTADLLVPAWKKGDVGKVVKREQKPVCPAHIRGDAVHYLFLVPDGDTEFETHRNTLIDAARSITHLGWGVDMVAGNGTVLSATEAANLPGERWQPTEGTLAGGLRVPISGTLNDVATKHTAFLNRLSEDGFNPVTPLSAFRVVGYRRATDPPPRRWAAFRLRHPLEDRAAVFSMTRANCVAAMTRHATALIAEQQGRDKDWIDRYIHGHRSTGDDSLPRFSYVPLPSLERRGERGIHVGAIRRVLVAELLDAGESHLQWARQMLPGQFLTEEKIDDAELRKKALLTPLTGGDWVLRQYTDDADTWVSVTPVVLPGCDARAQKRSGGRSGSSGQRTGKLAKAMKLFLKALRHAGYSPDALADDPEFSSVTFWPGGEQSLRYHRPSYLNKDYWSVYHVRIRWKQPVRGPLAIGAGRHCGLGVFAALKES